MPEADSSDSEDETLHALGQQLRRSKRKSNVHGYGEGDSDMDSEGALSDDDEVSVSSGEGSEYQNKSDESSGDEEEVDGGDESECSRHESKGSKTKNVNSKQRKYAPRWNSAAPASNWTYGRWLMGKTLEELEKMPNAEELYLKSLQQNIGIITERMESMMLGDQRVKVTTYPKKDKVRRFHDVLREYCKEYDEAIRDKAGLKKMPRLHCFLSCPKHAKITDYAIEYKLCGEEGCNLCPRMPRVKSIGDDELTREVLGLCPLPRLDAEGKTFLPIDECQKLLDKGATLAEELKDLERVRDEFKEKDTIQQERVLKDKELMKSINWTKVRFLLRCDDCKAVRCVFSRWAVGNPKGPTKKHMDAIQKYVDQNGYKCGDIIRVSRDSTVHAEHSKDEEEDNEEPILFCKEAHVCGTAIESQYYAPSDKPRKGGRVAAKYICCHCYTDGDLASRQDVMKTRTLGGKGILPICKSCLHDGAVPVTTRGKTNYLEAAVEKRAKKKDAKASRKRAKNS